MHWPDYDWIAFRQHPKSHVIYCYLISVLCLSNYPSHPPKGAMCSAAGQLKPSMDLDLICACVSKPKRETTGNILNISWTHLNTFEHLVKSLRSVFAANQGPQAMQLSMQQNHGPRVRPSTLTVSQCLSPSLIISRRLWSSISLNSVIWTKEPLRISKASIRSIQQQDS